MPLSHVVLLLIFLVVAVHQGWLFTRRTRHAIYHSKGIVISEHEHPPGSGGIRGGIRAERLAYDLFATIVCGDGFNVVR